MVENECQGNACWEEILKIISGRTTRKSLIRFSKRVPIAFQFEPLLKPILQGLAIMQVRHKYKVIVRDSTFVSGVFQ